MKKLNNKFLAIIALAFVFTACDEEKKLIEQRERENPIPGEIVGDAGQLDLSTYVAIGNSLTAGFQDGALYNDGQDKSFPNQLAKQFKTSGVGGGDFNQPNINSEIGFSSVNPSGGFFGRFELSLSRLIPVPNPNGEEVTAFAGDKSTLNNFGVPGMGATDIADPGFAANGYYARFATAPGTSTVLGDALSKNPTFFTYWLGNNDVLGYAVGGGADDSALTPIDQVQASLAQGMGALAQTGAQGVALTVPLIVTIPYLRAVPYNAIPMDDQATVDQLNAGFAGFNQVLDALAGNGFITADDANARKVSYELGANPILMADEYLTDIGPFMDILAGLGAISPEQRAALEPYRQARPATADDLPTLASATVLGTAVGGNPAAVIGVSVPAADQYILSSDEVNIVVGQRAAINATIAGVVAGVNQQAGAEVINLVDVQPTMADLAGLDPQTAAGLVDPSLIPGSGFPAFPALREMANNAAARADGQLGILEQGTKLDPDFGPNGVYSTDGIHPNPRGAALFGNLIIQTLNSNKGASIPLIDVLALRGIIATQ